MTDLKDDLTVGWDFLNPDEPFASVVQKLRTASSQGKTVHLKMNYCLMQRLPILSNKSFKLLEDAIKVAPIRKIANSSPVLEDVDIKFYFSQGQDLVTAFAAIIHDFSRSRIVNLTIRDAFDSLSSEDGEIAGAMAGLTRLQTFTLCSTPGFYHTILPPLLSMPTLTKISLTSSRDSRVIVNLVDTQAIAALLRMDGKICIILRGLEFPAQSSWELCNAIAESRVEKLQIEICGFDSLLPARSLGPSHLKDLQIIGCWNNLHTNVRQFLAAVLLNVPRLERLELTQLDGPYFSKTAVYAESVAKTQSTSSFL